MTNVARIEWAKRDAVEVCFGCGEAVCACLLPDYDMGPPVEEWDLTDPRENREIDDVEPKAALRRERVKEGR